jgi:hypothetical protein
MWKSPGSSVRERLQAHEIKKGYARLHKTRKAGKIIKIAAKTV